MSTSKVSDSYQTVKLQGPEILYKSKGSKFYGNVFPFTDPDHLKDIIDSLQQQHNKAGHHCFAYRIDDQYRANDDGEPSHTSGDPILGQIDAHELNKVLVVVSRIFGGTKLGVSGLIKSYREAARLAIEASEISTALRTKIVVATCTYDQLSALNRFVAVNSYTIKNQELKQQCRLWIEVPLSEVGKIEQKSASLYQVNWDLP